MSDHESANDAVPPSQHPASGSRHNTRPVIISGPSGSGKSTVVRQLILRQRLPLVLSVSATTRDPRPGENDAEHYHFISDAAFQQMRDDNAFLECKEVFGRGHWYGTPLSEVTSGLNRGQWVILEIDVQGALSLIGDENETGASQNAAVSQFQQLQPISIFIHSGGMDELERRLRGRGTETESAIRRRLETAQNELRLRDRYQYEIINDRVDATVDQIESILLQNANPPGE
ncbi:MAG: guanylate kinase [Planctomycetota bacterium]